MIRGRTSISLGRGGLGRARLILSASVRGVVLIFDFDLVSSGGGGFLF